ncbi:hypothetical protein B0F90DRAFT_1706727 [Multifurca ochricompacta]|uniref:Cep57 centrosome microtubule-binding domain-containing protein n=1 Tax=Multifurca ochricompacta TaxID=376703 RepID=A0AAD4QQF2_9AGAM|nr:hypothetical protein B0F90DRAFT_1706727 [Multifurca ochricompacta]
MGRAPPKFDISIAGDEQEQSRIQLEKNLLHTDLSLHLSSTHDDYSVENPRHQPGVSAPFSAFHSIDRSREAFDMDEGLSQLHAWSYHTGEDDEGIHPFVGGETLSTAAHHASALTLSAGLGGRGERRDISFSGAEYDPERPLQDLIAGIRSNLTLFDELKAPSRTTSNPVPFDPLVVDSTAELNQVLSPQHVRAASLRVRSPHSEQSTSSSSSEPDTPDPTTSKPKLSETLSHLMFSPKRPRSPALSARSASPAQLRAPARRPTSTSNRSESQHLPQTHQVTVPPSSLRAAQPEVGEGEPTPRPRRVHLHAQIAKPDNVPRPPTPSTTNSNFTRLARGLAREIEAEQSRWHAPMEVEGPHISTKGSGSTQSVLRAKAVLVNAPVSSNGKKKQVQLPDVTGLTVAVESPAKGQPYQSCGDIGKEYDDKEGHARLQLAMNLLQTKIAHLDVENHTSRRRMKELERELDVCRRDVERQRELVMQREEFLSIQQRAETVNTKMKGKARVVGDAKEEQKRYKQAVEEKKALESLILTLRSHMARLSSELASHKTLLDELRSLREADKHTLRQKVREVDLLRREVEKIAGEVEVLKGVVEEGLRERRERSLSYSHDEPQVHDPDDNKREDGGSFEVERTQDDAEGPNPDAQQYANYEEIEDVQPALARRALLERTTHTDQATFGSSPVAGGGSNTRRYVEDIEVDRISAELEERRSERSRSSSRLGSSISSDGSHRAPSVASSARNRQIASSPPGHAATLGNIRQENQSPPPRPFMQDSRPTAPTPAHAAREWRPADETPFPQIRGARLERMFFSAPEHNAKTCTVCHRRRHHAPRPLWYPATKGRNVTVGEVSDEDEGFEEGSVAENRDGGKASEGAAVTLDFLNEDARSASIPPQTVLVRVLRELEDDFTHYKGIYTELADQYKIMDADSNVVKRNALAQHLREVIDILEQRGDQIASLYDLLTFEDKPVARSVVPEKDSKKHGLGPTGLERTRASGSRKRLTFA